MRTLLALALATALAPPAHATEGALGAVEDGDATYEFINWGDLFEPFNPLVAGFSNFKALHSDGQDNLRQQWFYYRLDATSAEQALPPPNTATYSSNPGTFVLTWEAGPSLPFSARLVGEVRDTGLNKAVLVQQLTLTNAGAGPLTVELFHYAAITVNEFFGGFDDTAVLVGPNRIRIDDNGTFAFDEYAALSADGWKVQAFNNLLQFDLLNATPSNFNNVGLPFAPGFFTGGFHWSLAIPAGSSRSATVGIGVGDSASLELTETPWTDLGGAKPGGLGAPQLTGSGSLLAGSSNHVDLDDANPSSAATLVVGLSALNAPFKGGTLVPNPFLLLPLPTGATGTARLSFLMPAGAPTGTNLFFQWWISDPGATFGLAASNGLRGTTP